jgi:hypothetical protein
MVALAVGCGDDAEPGQSMDARADAGDAPVDVAGEPMDGAGPGDASGADTVDVTGGEPPPPGKITGTVVNASADSLAFPGDIRFRIAVEGHPGLVTTSVWRDNQHRFELAEVPAGARGLRVQELDPEGKDDTWDLFQASSRQLMVEVASGGTTSAMIPVRSHWEVHKVDGGDTIRSCEGIRQIAFRNQTQGAVLFQQGDGHGGIAGSHAAVMVTQDGGLTWSVATKQMVAGAHSLATGNWFGTRPLLYLPGGELLSLPQFGPVLRSTDGGAGWQPVAVPAPTWGPGNVEWTGLVHSGNALYAPVWTGGVQGSNTRTSLHRSTDAGLTWQTIIDRCDRSEAEHACSNSRQPDLPVDWSGIDVGCGPAGHCVVVGRTTVLYTTDGFATWKTFSALPPGYGCSYAVNAGRAYWIPGTSTGWVVANASACGNPPAMRRVTTDGGVTWGDWEPSPVSSGGDLAFGDAQTGFSLEVRHVRITRDGGKTFKHTGAPPHDRSSHGGLRMAVVGPDHAWVSADLSGGCQNGSHSWVARWRP